MVDDRVEQGNAPAEQRRQASGPQVPPRGEAGSTETVPCPATRRDSATSPVGGVVMVGVVCTVVVVVGAVDVKDVEVGGGAVGDVVGVGAGLPVGAGSPDSSPGGRWAAGSPNGPRGADGSGKIGDGRHRPFQAYDAPPQLGRH